MTKRLPKPLLIALLIAVSAAIAPQANARADGYYSPQITIPRLGINQKAQRTLATGPVVYYHDADTIGIAAHNVTPVSGYNGHGPFHYLHSLQTGDTVIVNGWRYKVAKKLIIRPNQTWVLNWKGVILSACYPDHSAAFRKVVLASPVGPA
jgi:sortase (surface protein transpeptidase)